MSDSQYIGVIRIWAAMAWADGVVKDAERIAMTRLIEAAGLSEEEYRLAISFLENRVELDTDAIAGLSDSAKEGVYRAAMRLAMVDRDMAQEEVRLLGQLGRGLGLDDATCARIAEQLS